MHNMMSANNTVYPWSSKVSVKRSVAMVNAALKPTLRSTPLTALKDVSAT